MNRKRYLFFDIDGTLLAGGYHDTYIPDSTVLALEKCRAAGHFLCIATGRLQAMAVDCMHELGFTNMVSDGGYGITIDDKFYGAIPLPGEPVVRLIAECVALSMPWAIQTDNTVYRTAPDSRFEDFTHDPYMKTRVVPGLDPRSFDKISSPSASSRSWTGSVPTTATPSYSATPSTTCPCSLTTGPKSPWATPAPSSKPGPISSPQTSKTTASITPASPWASSEALFLFSHRAHTAALLFHIIDIPFILHVFPSSFSSIPLSFSLYWRNFRQ